MSNTDVVFVGNQAFADYRKWECYAAGMYETRRTDEPAVAKSTEVLSNPDLFQSLCDEVAALWRISAAVNLTNPHTNHNAYMGRACCCFASGATITETTQAWSSMSKRLQAAANDVAAKAAKKTILNLREEACRRASGGSGFLF